MRSVNNQYKFYPTLRGNDLPYDFEIELSMKVYYRKDGVLRRTDSIFLKSNKWIYEVKRKEELKNNDIKRVQEPIK